MLSQVDIHMTITDFPNQERAQRAFFFKVSPGENLQTFKRGTQETQEWGVCDIQQFPIYPDTLFTAHISTTTTLIWEIFLTFILGEKECELGGGRERERERKNPKQAPHSTQSPVQGFIF